MSGVKIEGSLTGYTARIDTNNLLTRLPLSSAPTLLGAVMDFSEDDSGDVTGTPYINSPIVDDDFRRTTSYDICLDTEVFSYLTQNTGKHTYTSATMTAAWKVGAVTTNAGSSITAGQGLTFGTYAYFPLLATLNLYCEMTGSFTTAFATATNTTIDFGLFLRGAANDFVPTDGVYFRLTSAGMVGVLNYNTTETPTTVFAFSYNINQTYKFVIAITTREVEFWIDDVLYATASPPSGNGQPFAAASLPFSVRHAVVTSNAAAAISFQLANYGITTGGSPLNRGLDEYGNAAYGSYQTLSGFATTHGSLALYVNNANPTAAVPTNTTAALGVGLGGQVWETDTLAVTTDGIILSYLNPVASAQLSNRRLRVQGVTISSFVQTALTSGGYVAQWMLCYGHNLLTLATLADTAVLKMPRRIPIGVQAVASGAAVSTLLSTVRYTFQNAIYVNPGEYIAVAKRKVGTAPSAGVIGHIITYDYAWE